MGRAAMPVAEDGRPRSGFLESMNNTRKNITSAMSVHWPGPKPEWRAGFTLIEMMTVIVIITILAAFLFPVVLNSQRWMREKRAAAEVKNIAVALRGYHSVYGKWPGQTQSLTDTCHYADNSAVLSALTNNPRRINFLQFQESSIGTNEPYNGSYLDPWLHPYVIVMDENFDRQVDFKALNVVLTNLNGKVTTNTLNFSVPVSVGVVSWGELREPLRGEYNMDLNSWQEGAKTK